jgi:hypothetical protein
MSLSQCRHALIHLVSGACVEHKSDVHLHSKLDRSTCAVIAEEFESPPSMNAAVLELILATDDKKITAEPLCHVAAAIDDTPSGRRNLRFKLSAAMHSHLQTCEFTSVESRSSVSVAEFIKSFEAHRRPVLLFIAALHVFNYLRNVMWKLSANLSRNTFCPDIAPNCPSRICRILLLIACCLTGRMSVMNGRPIPVTFR